MKPLQYLRHIVGLRSPLRIVYHWTRGVLAYTLSGNPTKGMYVIGVTGTKGKTTTSTLIATALETSGRQVCLLSTAQVWMAGEKSENQSKMTMDSPFKLWKMIRKAKKMGVTHLVLETSSHGIYYFRNFGIQYDIVALTNISQDHLDLHGTMDHYVKTKARLFKKEQGKICILPRDCQYFDVFSREAGKEAVTYSMKQSADYQTRSLKTDGDGIDIVIKSSIPLEEGRITSKLVGVFNAENILTAYATLRTMGIETAPIQEGWKNFTGVPGRMEPVPNTQGLTILVDYAHTETSLRSVLETLRVSMKNNKLVVVFGATGDRDTTKRPKMGAVVHELADIIVLTDDDTYTEPSGRIIDMVQKGIPRETGDTFQIIPDRKEAIHWALRKAQKGDIVLIAGKGCETVQVTNAGPIPWSDRGIVEELLG
ncbi:UDP-N-acetylmuramoyl-L-alanyl-D-glutamate--2,6-diaminopimelate ligase [Candidatus Gracilibacteria bacterium]|nr:UDP-N-acetylmuramoyl-L-alanyl-D-glutamate--2,6-diaminopimelate ligase [Candidatus Gracilibacteria bacterium]